MFEIKISALLTMTDNCKRFSEWICNQQNFLTVNETDYFEGNFEF